MTVLFRYGSCRPKWTNKNFTHVNSKNTVMKYKNRASSR